MNEVGPYGRKCACFLRFLLLKRLVHGDEVDHIGECSDNVDEVGP